MNLDTRSCEAALLCVAIHVYGVSFGGSVSQDFFMGRRGNPNWGRAMPLVPGIPTEFEITANRLHLMPEKYAFSRELKRWCESNFNRCYVPEWLLKEWGLKVELYFVPDPARKRVA
jgi:hypothetical protein